MTIAYKDKLSTRLYFPLLIIFGLISIILSFHVPNITKGETVKQQTLAEQFANAISDIKLPTEDINKAVNNINKQLQRFTQG